MRLRTALLIAVSLLEPLSAHATPWSLAVVDDKGAPVAASVLFSAFDQTFTDTHTDETGHLSGDSTASYNRNVGSVIIYAPGHAVAGGRLHIGDNKAILGAPITLQGRVLDIAGHPLQGVNVSVDLIYPAGNEFNGDLADLVQCSLYPHAGKIFTARTDTAGRYTLHDLPPSGRAVVSVREPGWESVRITADLGAPGDTADLRARPAARLTGRVVDEGGRPLPGVALSASLGLDGERLQTATDENGRYTIAGLPPGMITVSLLDAPQNPGLVAPRLQIMTERDDATAAPDIVAGPGAEVELDLPPAAGGGGSFELTPDEPNQLMSYHLFQGPITRVRVLPGRYRLVVATGPPGFYAPDAPAAGIVVNAVAGPSVKLSIALKPSFTLTGIARDEDGTRISGADIGLEYLAATVTTAEDGSFALPDLRPGPVRLSCKNGWDIVGSAQIAVPQTEPVDLKLRKSQTAPLEGRVVAENGAPIAGALITVSWNAPRGDGAETMVRREVRTDADGHYRLQAVYTRAKPTLEVEKAGYLSLRGGDIAIQSTMIGLDGQVRTNPSAAFKAGDLVLEPLSRRVTGRVVDGGGRPLPNALVAALAGGTGEPNVTPRNITRTDGEGRFILNGLPEADVDFVAGAGAAFASFHSQGSDVGDIALKPQAAAPPDAALARQVVQRIATGTNEHDSIRNDLPLTLAPYDLAGALQAVKSANGDAAYTATILTRGLKMVAPGDRDSARRQLPALLSQIDAAIGEVGPPFVTVRAEISTLVPATSAVDNDSADDAVLRNWLKRGYDKAATALAAMPIDTSVNSDTAQEFASMAVLANRLGDGAADGWAVDALGIAARADADIHAHPDHYDGGSAGQPGGYWAARVMATLAEAGPALVEGHLGAVVAEHRYLALGAAVPVVAPADPAAARRLLVSMEAQKSPAPVNANDKAAEEAHDTAFTAVITVMPRAQAQQALSMARSVQKNGPLALALAARLLPPAQAAPLFREAFAVAENAEDFALKLRVTQLASASDPAFGKELQDSLYENCFDADNLQHDPKFALRALTAARAMPGMARAWLEWAWAQPADTNWYYGDGRREVGIAGAMAAIDTNRALEMARSLTGRSRSAPFGQQFVPGMHWQAENKIAQYLAVPQNERDNIVFDN